MRHFLKWNRLAHCHIVCIKGIPYPVYIGLENLLKKSWPKVNYANIEMVKKGQNKRSSRSLRHMRQFLSFFEWVLMLH